MDIEAEKLSLIREIEHIQDIDLIKELRLLLAKANDDLVVGYEINGDPITRSALIQQIEEAEAQIDRGEYITQEDLEKDSENW